jgi:hypothetical protein
LGIKKIVNGLVKFSWKGDMDLSMASIDQELESILSIVEKEMSL